MIKICPECLNLNGEGEVCKTCGFPLGKKVIGKLEDYYFYDAIELYNLGHRADAENRVREKQKTLNDQKITLLIEKFELANNLVKSGEDCAARALDQLRLGNFQSAMAEIKAASNMYASPRFLEIEQQIERAQSERANRDRARTLAEDSKLLYANGSVHEAIQTMLEAVKLSGNNPEYKAAYDHQIEELTKSVTQEVRSQLDRGDFKTAELTLAPILPYASLSPAIHSLQMEIQAGLGKQKQKKRTVFTVSFILIAAVVVVAGWFLWQNNERKNRWQAVLSDGSIPAIEAYIQENPDSKYLPDAIQKLEELKNFDSTEWSKANLFISSASMRTYLTNVLSIKGLHIDRANAIIDSIDWFDIEKSEDTYQYENYINTHPNSLYITLARGKIAEQVTGSERDNLLEYIKGFYSTVSNNDLESLMMYFEPITPAFGSRTNILKADLRTIFENDRKTIESSSVTIDPVSFKVKKDNQNNYYINYYTDTYTTRTIAPVVEGEEQQSVDYFSNAEWFITLNENRKIISYKYKVISEKQTNQ